MEPLSHRSDLDTKNLGQFVSFTFANLARSTQHLRIVFSWVMKHEDIRWNPELQEWFCVRCGRTSDHLVRGDAEVEMEQFECEVPAKEHPPK
jgi:hypothetical protein